MKISTRGRYALRVLIDLAGQPEGVYVPLRDITERQDISQKYLESIMTTLSKAGLVDALHGKGGGYRLNRKPSEYTVAEILALTEGDLSPVSCLAEGAAPCERALQCKTLPVWDKLNVLVHNYLSSVTLDTLM